MSSGQLSCWYFWEHRDGGGGGGVPAIAGLVIDARSREKMDLTAKELAEEKELADECLKA